MDDKRFETSRILFLTDLEIREHTNNYFNVFYKSVSIRELLNYGVSMPRRRCRVNEQHSNISKTVNILNTKQF